MIASPSDIRSAIRAYYGDQEETASPPSAPPAPSVAFAAPTAPPVAAPARPPVAAPAPAPARPPVAAPVAAAAPAAAPVAAAVPVATRPAAPVAATALRPVRMIALTLLDGTTIQLPTAGAAAAAPEPRPEADSLTTRDLVAALRAIAHGASAEDILPGGRWEPMMAALLSLLLKKHLIADWEFVEELKKG